MSAAACLLPTPSMSEDTPVYSMGPPVLVATFWIYVPMETYIDTLSSYNDAKSCAVLLISVAYILCIYTTYI